jgi:hypothetical protein
VASSSTDDGVPHELALGAPAEQAEGGHRHAVRAAGQVDLLVQHDGDDDAHAQGAHRQVVALELEDRPGDREGQQADAAGAADERRQGRPAVRAGQDRRAIGAQGEEAGVA